MPDFITTSCTSPIRTSNSYTAYYYGQNETQAKINYFESEIGKLRDMLTNLSFKVKEQEAKIKELELESLMK